MSTKVDLSVLAVRRDAPPGPSPGRRRHLLTRYVLPAVLLAGFAALLAYAARETLSPPRPVTVVPVLTTRSEGRSATDEPLFQAAGWVEPRPGPTFVPALTEGVVEELLVVEGQDVSAGQPVARLTPADARLALSAAEADVQLRDAELAAARAALTAARERAERPVHLQAELAEAEVALARSETERANLPPQRRAAEARLRQTRQAVERLRQGGSPAVSLERAEAEAEVAAAAVEEMKAKAERLPVEIAALTRKRDALRERLERRTDERRQLAEAQAAVQAGEARLRQTQATAEAARLRLERTTVRAPAAGRVLSIAARPGTHVAGGHDPSTVALLYDPRAVQARVDVRLEDVGRVQTGMRVRIESAAAPGRALAGEVLMVTAQADIQKNTLPVKVALPDPPPALRPDMLVRVTFLAPPRPAPSPGDEGSPLRLLVPRQLVDSADGASRVWVADRVSGRAVSRAVKLGSVDGELVEVVAGLDPTDKLIAGGRDGLRDGERVRVTGEDEALGIPAQPSKR
jgi:RND family efflux transporter MFP subunit